MGQYSMIEYVPRLLPAEYRFLIGGWNKPGEPAPTEKVWVSCLAEGWIDDHSNLTPKGRAAINEFEHRNLFSGQMERQAKHEYERESAARAGAEHQEVEPECNEAVTDVGASYQSGPRPAYSKGNS